MMRSFGADAETASKREVQRIMTLQNTDRPAGAGDQAGGEAMSIRPDERARILVVDDDERNLFAMEEVLKDIGQVVTVRLGEEALKQLLQHDFAVVLLDVLMPGMDGYEAAASIRSRERSRHVPIIFLTALNKDDVHLRRGYSMGAVDYVFKPVDPLILRSKVSVFVDLFNKAQEIRRKAMQEQRLREENSRVRTEKIMAEQALRWNEERQAAIIKALPLALYANDVPARAPMQLSSPRFIGDKIEAICGFDSSEFRANQGLWRDRIHPDDRDHVLYELERLRTSGSMAVEYRWRGADGQYRFILDQAVLMRDPDGEPREIVGSWMDVSERRGLEQQLAQAQKMDAIGKLTGGIAHDFNNMLTVVIGSLERIRNVVEGDPVVRRRVELALEGASRCSDLTRRLLTFARRQPLQPRLIDLNQMVVRVADMVRRIIGDAIELRIGCDEDLWPTLADPSQVESALINLVVNARDAMSDGGTLTLSTRNVHVDATDPLCDRGIGPGRYVVLSVADSGVGIPAEIRDRVFEPFFTTKEAGQGTGLGLSIIYGFVKQSGGHITLESEIGAGTTITIYLPQCAAQPRASAPASCDDGIPRARAAEVVLVVEDDPTVRSVAVNMLRDLGYSVIEASDGRAALEELDRAPRVDLLFTDLAMPGGLNGRDLIREAIRRESCLKALLTSAYTDQLWCEAGTDMAVHLLEKPYRERDLARAVRAVLDGT